jgi:hypothetical protein
MQIGVDSFGAVISEPATGVYSQRAIELDVQFIDTAEALSAQYRDDCRRSPMRTCSVRQRFFRVSMMFSKILVAFQTL